MCTYFWIYYVIKMHQTSSSSSSSSLLLQLLLRTRTAAAHFSSSKQPVSRSSESAPELRELLFSRQNKMPRKKNGLRRPNVGIAGATGAVGIEMRRCLEERQFPINELALFAHPDEEGDLVEFAGERYPCEVAGDGAFDGLDIVLFSAGSEFSVEQAPKAAAAGCIVVDNSAEFRMDPDVPLVVPEVNAHAAARHKGIIANPNCTTILMNVPVHPLHKAFGVERAVVCTYQAASGAGLDAMSELEQQARDWAAGKSGDGLTQDIFGRQYIWNLFCHNSPQYQDNGYNEEEWKMVVETPKIFEDDRPRVAVTCVRVPVLRAHCESINLQFQNKVGSLDEIYEVLHAAPGIRVVDDRVNNKHPEPLDASGEFDILVGRVRWDQSVDEGYGIDMFIAGDQLLKGAALNAVQIAELLLEEKAIA
jgi:aspartate-semialdehyde dehydrogenase